MTILRFWLIQKKKLQDNITWKKISDITSKCSKLKKALTYIKKAFIDSGNNVFVTVDTLIDMNKLITGLGKITLRKFNVKLHGYDKINK